MADLLIVTAALAMPVSLATLLLRASSIAARVGLSPLTQP